MKKFWQCIQEIFFPVHTNLKRELSEFEINKRQRANVSINKETFNAIWGACFDYKPLDHIVEGIAVEQRIVECWYRLTEINGLINKDFK